MCKFTSYRLAILYTNVLNVLGNTLLNVENLLRTLQSRIFCWFRKLNQTDNLFGMHYYSCLKYFLQYNIQKLIVFGV